jgi:hypothetical protein
MIDGEYKRKLKLECFEYIIFKFKKWYEEDGRLDFSDMMSRLKAQKLLFFCAVIKNPYGEDLLNIFNKWHLTSTGFLESEIYYAMVDDSFENMRIKDFIFSFKTKNFQSNLSSYYKEKIDIAIGCLKVVSPKLIHKHAFELSDLHKCWILWQAGWITSKSLNKSCIQVSTDEIRKCKPIF